MFSLALALCSTLAHHHMFVHCESRQNINRLPSEARFDLKNQIDGDQVPVEPRFRSKCGPQGWLIISWASREIGQVLKLSEVTCPMWLFWRCIFEISTLVCYLCVWYSLNLPGPVALFVKGSITWHLPRLVWTEAEESKKLQDVHSVLRESVWSLVAKHAIIKVSFQLLCSWSNTQFLGCISKILFLSNSPSSNINTADKFLTVPLKV